MIISVAYLHQQLNNFNIFISECVQNGNSNEQKAHMIWTFFEEVVTFKNTWHKKILIGT